MDFGKNAMLNKKDGPGSSVGIFSSSRSRIPANPLAQSVALPLLVLLFCR